ncbi:GDSL esterase/lipase 5-like [Prosopis cineraria]|uniref:GDSL esterase/lipase 5-like n=1 Tax=Prosopis cineraria TaxID=364024 RepID=UPI0024108AA5|nr:GDSL esterase/lipase 5-like [Prosopis cineraria]
MHLKVVVLKLCQVGEHSCVLSRFSLFTFGDLIFDSFFFGLNLIFDFGNNNYINTVFDLLSNYEPYGQTFFKFPTGRFFDGRVIPDFIVECAKLPLLPPYLYPGTYNDNCIYGVNFASSGAGALVETRPGTKIYEEGGRRFSLVNAAPFSCFPLLRRNGSSVSSFQEEEAASLARLHDNALPNKLQKLQQQLEGLTYIVFHYHSALFHY